MEEGGGGERVSGTVVGYIRGPDFSMVATDGRTTEKDSDNPAAPKRIVSNNEVKIERVNGTDVVMAYTGKAAIFDGLRKKIKKRGHRPWLANVAKDVLENIQTSKRSFISNAARNTPGRLNDKIEECRSQKIKVLVFDRTHAKLISSKKHHGPEDYSISDIDAPMYCLGSGGGTLTTYLNDLLGQGFPLDDHSAAMNSLMEGTHKTCADESNQPDCGGDLRCMLVTSTSWKMRVWKQRDRRYSNPGAAYEDKVETTGRISL